MRLLFQIVICYLAVENYFSEAYKIAWLPYWFLSLPPLIFYSLFISDRFLDIIHLIDYLFFLLFLRILLLVSYITWFFYVPITTFWLDQVLPESAYFSHWYWKDIILPKEYKWSFLNSNVLSEGLGVDQLEQFGTSLDFDKGLIDYYSSLREEFLEKKLLEKNYCQYHWYWGPIMRGDIVPKRTPVLAPVHWYWSVRLS